MTMVSTGTPNGGWNWGNLGNINNWNTALGITNNPNLVYQNSNQLAGAAYNGAVGDYGFGQQQQQQLLNAQNAIGSQQQYLQGLMSGQNSVSAQQLKQSLGQQLAMQQAAAAGANPNNSAMASRNAMQNMGQSAYGMSGQQALAGIQERNAAAGQLANLNLGAGQLANSAYGNAMGAANQSLGVAGNQYSSQLGNPQKGAAQALLGMMGGIAGGAAASDRRLKRDIAADDDDHTKSRAILKAIKPYTYSYKDPRFGEGEQYGVMAQDLEKGGLAHAVMNTPYGKMVNAGKAATAGLALSASLAKRIDELEKEREGRGKRASTEEDDEEAAA
jgi:hypothetical protein